MPAYTTHTLFSHMALEALSEAGHPLAAAARQHAALFRIAGIAGCDIQCMPYQVCTNCQAPYRHDQKERRTCLVCGGETLVDFEFATADGRRLRRTDVERDLYANTHLVLYRRYLGYGVKPQTPAGPPEQPLPQQAVDHLAFCLMDAEKVAGPKGQVSNYVAFVLGWFTHVVSDAIFKGVYPQAVRVRFFGHQYDMQMLPAAETLSLTDIAHDWGVHWPSWHEELLKAEEDGGALRHLAMGDEPEMYDRNHWTDAHGKPDPAIGRVIDVVQPINRTWFRQMYVQPDYSAPTPRLDRRPMETRATHRFGQDEMDLGRLRRYAIGTGWYDCFLTGVEVYLNAVAAATTRAGIKAVPGADAAPRPAATQPGGAGPHVPGWGLWREVVGQAARRQPQALPGDWGSRLEVHPDASRLLRAREMRLVLPVRPTDYHGAIATALQEALKVRVGTSGPRILIGPPTHNGHACDLLCGEDALRKKYEQGVAAVVGADLAKQTLLLAGLSEFGDHLIIEWLRGQAV